jgi:hypothetical protein
MKHRGLVVGLICALAVPPANAYEIGTHALITYEASARSVLSPNHVRSIRRMEAL